VTGSGPTALEAGNIFADIAVDRREEHTRDLLATPGVKIERIVSHGQRSADGFWYDQDRVEWVIVLAGAAQVEFEGEAAPRKLSPGDYLHIPAHRRHRVAWTDPAQATVWLAVHYA
jgi:cupin 2 domain-containing protein